MWKIKTKDGKEFSELNAQWNDVKDNIAEMVLITKDGRTIYLPKNMEKYIQFKTASVELGKNDVQIESRSIGFQLGNNIVKIRVNEKNGNIVIEAN